MKKTILLVLFILQATIAHANCLDDSALAKLKQSEIEYLISKIPPAFTHGLQAGDIQIDVSPINNQAACEAQLTITVPEADMQEATAMLAAQPAKQIMLAAQGYALPSQMENYATFSVNPDNLTIKHEDALQTGSLGKLRANIELMYAFITQKRAALVAGQTNNEAWPKPLQNKVLTTCAANNSTEVCQCLLTQYESVIAPKQMAYILDVEENPYAAATGANKGFYAYKSQAQHACVSKH